MIISPNSVMKELVVLSLWLVAVSSRNRNEDGLVSSYTPRSGIASYFVGGLLKPVDLIINQGDRSNGNPNIIQGTLDEVVKEPLLTVADTIDAKLKAISPGTQWCGSADRARSSDELGIFKNTDDCCRHHDNCPEYILGYGSKYGLNNTDSFTRSRCDCDDEFYDCLKRANSVISLKIGTLFFNVLHPKCFKLEYPIAGCEGHTGLFAKRCKKYKLDTSRPQEWQWFDAREY